MIALSDLTRAERELLLQLFQSIDVNALSTVFDPSDTMKADLVKDKVIVMLNDLATGFGE
jgi:hypothetical protein